MKTRMLICGTWAFLLAAVLTQAQIKVDWDHNGNGQAKAGFKFKNVPSPSKNDAATGASFTIVDGEPAGASGGISKLNDGKLPTDADEPGNNFFFASGTDGGRLQIDLGRAIDIKQVNSYSWHPGNRGPQVYKIYGSEGRAKGFNPQPKRPIEPQKAGWKLIASVDTRPKTQGPGGQDGVSISNAKGTLGKYRYLLFDCFKTESDDDSGNTLYSEIDIVDRNGPAPEVVETPAPTSRVEKTFETEDHKYQITVDSSAAPDLTEWAEKELAPVAQEWYPKIVKLLPGEGFAAPTHFTIRFKNNMGKNPAYTSGAEITCNSEWFRRNLAGEAKGAVVHEMVHVVQQYGEPRRRNPDRIRPPGWLVEGIPDYIRWFLYEPESKGAEITTQKRLDSAQYDAMYRVSANFLNWASAKYDKDIVKKLNVLCREGKYTDDVWKQYTGKTIQELNDEWRKNLQEKIGTQ